MSPRAAWRLEAAGFGPVYDYVAGKADWLAADLPSVLVLNQAGVVMGAAYRDRLVPAAGEAAVGSVLRFGVSTVRPSEDAAALVHRMSHAQVTREVVTRSDGTLVGLFFAADVTS